MGSRRTGFVLDAKSMGLNPSRPPSPSPSATPKNQDSLQSKQMDQDSTSKLDIQSRERSTVEGSSHAQCNASTESVSTDYYRSLLQKLRDATGDVGKVNFELNNIFLNRLAEIDCLDGQGGDAMYTSQLRLVTFQEWVDFLLHVNNVVLGNMSDLESEAYGKIVTCLQSVQGEQQQTLEENHKLQKDISAIMKFVRTAYYHHEWDTNDITLETMTVNELLGLGKDQIRPESESEKMGECMKSLVNEIAEKHDEISLLKSQISDLDEIVITARQKLLLKDQCIAQLNQQLQEITECMVTMSDTHGSSNGPSVNATDLVRDVVDSPSDTVTADTITCEMLENLSMQDNQESEMLRLLNSELNELFDLRNKQDFQAMECRRKRLSCFFKKLTSERDDTIKKLENIRFHLSILQSDIDHSCISSINPGTGPGDPDAQVIEILRNRMRSLGQSNRELHGKYQRLDTESKIKISELQARIESESSFNQRNIDILKEIAELISKMGCMDFSYNEIYDESSTENPFCTAITKLCQQISKKEQKQVSCNEHLTCQIQGLQDNLKDRDKQIDQLQSMIKSYSDFSENNQLKGEIYELKQKNCDLSRHTRELSGLLRSQEDQRVQLCTKYENLMSSFEDQCQELQIAKKKVQTLQTRLEQVEQLQDELRTERKMLREEVIALKEKEAVSAGRVRALQEQQKNGQLEVEKVRQHVRDLQAQIQLEDSQHHDCKQRMEKAAESMKENFRVLSDKCEQLQESLKQQTEVKQQQEQIIASFRKWKDAQVRADDAMSQCAKQNEEHIHMLLDENRSLAEDYRNLYRDHSLLETEMLRVRQAVNYASTSSMGCPPQTSNGRMNPEAENDLAWE
ncbi:protein Daple isoform X3 [Drosophila eugracilis]|uniref:protein Daple isoform X3 n=1 Tax=Drosophila eugracilis TaxID=29029 RepID=UPI001BD98AC5|nr:protein Daple isoform X3 [Drosophila eugracilis]